MRKLSQGRKQSRDLLETLIKFDDKLGPQSWVSNLPFIDFIDFIEIIIWKIEGLNIEYYRTEV